MKIARMIIAPMAAGLAISAIILLPQNAFMRDARDRYRLLCDATFAASVILIGASTIAYLSRKGTYDNFTKALRTFWLPFLHPAETKQDGGTKAKQEGKRKGSPIHSICIGLVFGIASAIFYGLYSVNS